MYGRGAPLWWGQNEAALARLENVSVVECPASITVPLASFAERSMRIDCTVQDGEIWLAANGETLHFAPTVRKR